MNWDYQSPERAFDDVLLPLDLEDLARSRPQASHSMAYRVAWLLRKAAIFDRLAVSDTEVQNEATGIAWHARRTALRLQRDIARELVSGLLIDEEVFEEGPSIAQQIGFKFSS